MNHVEKMKQFLNGIAPESIIFKKHFHNMMRRPCPPTGLIRRILKNTSKIEHIEDQPAKKDFEEKYKLRIKLSEKYNVSLICIKTKKNLYIITAWYEERS